MFPAAFFVYSTYNESYLGEPVCPREHYIAETAYGISFKSGMRALGQSV
jgi:hypothetical protein